MSLRTLNPKLAHERFQLADAFLLAGKDHFHFAKTSAEAEALQSLKELSQPLGSTEIPVDTFYQGGGCVFYPRCGCVSFASAIAEIQWLTEGQNTTQNTEYQQGIPHTPWTHTDFIIKELQKPVEDHRIHTLYPQIQQDHQNVGVGC